MAPEWARVSIFQRRFLCSRILGFQCHSCGSASPVNLTVMPINEERINKIILIVKDSKKA